MKATVKGMLGRYGPRLDYCSTCRRGFECIGAWESAEMKCSECKQPRQIIFQANDETTIEEYQTIKDEFLTNLRYGLSVNNTPEPMIEINFHEMQEQNDRQHEIITRLEETIDSHLDTISVLESEAFVLQRKIDDLTDALEDIQATLRKAI